MKSILIRFFSLFVISILCVNLINAQDKHSIGDIWEESQFPLLNKAGKTDTILTAKWSILFKYRENYQILGASNHNIPKTRKQIILSVKNDVYESAILCEWRCGKGFVDTSLAIYDKRINKFAIVCKVYNQDMVGSSIFENDGLALFIYDSLGRVEMIYHETLFGFGNVTFYKHTEKGSFESPNIYAIHTCIDYSMSYLLMEPYFFFPKIPFKHIDIPFFIGLMKEGKDKYRYDIATDIYTIYTENLQCED